MPVIRSGVRSLAKSGSAKLKGNVTLSEGSGVTLTQSGQDISIAASGGGSSHIYEKVVLSSSINSFSFTTPISLDTLGFIHFRCIFPGRMSNRSLRLLFNNDTTGSNYPRTMHSAFASTTSTLTSSSSNLGGLSTNSSTDNYTMSWDFEIRKTVGTYAQVYGKSSGDGSSNATPIRTMNLVYTGTTSDISDIRFNINSGNFPLGTVFILSEV